MGILRDIFVRGNTVEKVIDTAERVADKLTYTQQERAEMNKAIADAMAKYAAETMGESTDRSVTRRYLSLLLIAIYTLVALLVIGLTLANKQVLAGSIMSACKELYLDVAFVSIIVFFYGGYYAGKVLK